MHTTKQHGRFALGPVFEMQEINSLSWTGAPPCDLRPGSRVAVLLCRCVAVVVLVGFSVVGVSPHIGTLLRQVKHIPNGDRRFLVLNSWAFVEDRALVSPPSPLQTICPLSFQSTTIACKGLYLSFNRIDPLLIHSYYSKPGSGLSGTITYTLWVPSALHGLSMLGIGNRDNPDDVTVGIATV